MSDRNNNAADKDKHPAAKGAVAGGVVGGVAGGAATGMAVGGMTGPVGAVLGAAVGAAVGALAGRRKADPAVEDAYWRDNYASRPYVTGGSTYDDYGPAYRYGVSRYDRDRSFEDMEPELAEGWMGARGDSTLAWGEASPAARDAWERVGNRYRTDTV